MSSPRQDNACKKPQGKNPRTKLRGRKTDSPIMRFSKTLSYALRHGAEELQLDMRPDGYVAVAQILSKHVFRQYTEEQVEEVVRSDAKGRFSLITDDDGAMLIRANQGHTIKHVDEAALLTLITDASELPQCLHGTYVKFWDSILKKGLCRMTRNHIHLTTQEVTGGQVISGVRQSCDLLLYIDHAQAMADGIPFYRSSNNVVLTPGEGDAGILDRKYFLRAVTKKGEVVYERDAA
ncbi:TPA: hypothetical protein N0F65_010444 [Lagenidium giganteum]|uniref:2'-phosphotransferase n=1 Tax=Lagenidium giganteum TaxID=4803 RepID=A0AAV2YTU1_9STRA|nr:TPA: hypothetical protein N0F65_010444 [Lagenidium giganteum]